eukprot:NODE_1477_length_845_cov_3.139276_g1429_i0.p1 GENE.NODE_1477_length_845_cov_3.139276_g1429_i0~~NODE_1477_length_845_cov_3.139276_g1429_i0.p1  ORF type:complete len:247 (-),score=7.18 NODE_1477_length_845_cov_3.139276_g1429_i0:60-800(-)
MASNRIDRLLSPSPLRMRINRPLPATVRQRLYIAAVQQSPAARLLFCSQQNDAAGAKQAFSELFDPDRSHYTALITVLCASQDFNGVLKLLVSMPGNFLHPVNVAPILALLARLGKVTLIDEVGRHCQRNTSPNEFSHLLGTLLIVLARFDLVAEMVQWYGKYGQLLTLNQCHVVLRQCQNTTAAEAFFAAMQRNVSLTGESWDILLWRYIKENDVSKLRSRLASVSDLGAISDDTCFALCDVLDG